MKTYLISGAGSGIGRAIAEHFASDSSVKLVLVGRNEKNLEAVKKELPNAQQHQIIAADICDQNTLHDKFTQLKEQNLCAVIANAGIGGENNYGENDRWQQIIHTNLTGTYTFVNESLPGLRASKESFKHIIIISSILARIGVPGYTAYCTSKAGLLGLTRSLAVELSSEKILVNAICPGWVNTEMAQAGIEQFAKHTNTTFEQAHQEQMKPVPLKKMSEPKEIATLIAFLLSEQQCSITGQCLDINNGAFMP